MTCRKPIYFEIGVKVSINISAICQSWFLSLVCTLKAFIFEKSSENCLIYVEGAFKPQPEYVKVSKVAMIRNRYNQVPHLTQWESDKLTVIHHKREPRGQPFPSG